MVDPANWYEKYDKLKEYLRNERIKDGTDYAIVKKYGCANILCLEVYKNRIEEACAKHGVHVTAWHFWKEE